MENNKILLSAAAGLALVLTAVQVQAHCIAGQDCIPDPCNTHHGGACPPEIEQSMEAMRAVRQQASEIQKVFTVVEIETIEAPVDSAGRVEAVPKVELPPVNGSPAPARPNPSTGTDQSQPVPMTPAEFARQALPVRSERDLDLVKQGVLDGSRELLDAAASEDIASRLPSGESGRMKMQHLNFSSEALNQLRQYHDVMEKTRDMIGRGEMNISEDKWEEMEKLYRYTQSIIQRRGVPGE